jgi:hypothetical protein
VARDPEDAGDLLGDQSPLLRELGAVQGRGHVLILGFVLDHENAVRAGPGSQALDAALTPGLVRVGAELQQPRRPGDAAFADDAEERTCVFDELVAEPENTAGLTDGGETGQAVYREALDERDIGLVQQPLRTCRRVAEPKTPVLDLGPNLLGMDEAKLRDLAVGRAVLPEIAGASDRQVEHQRRDEVGLRHAETRTVEQIDQLPGRHPLPAGLGLPVDVDRE